MNLVLDTHALLWYTLNDPHLSADAQALILDADNDVLLSPASFWELAIKISIGKLTLHQPFEDFVQTCLIRYGFALLPIEPTHTVRLAALPRIANHKDPFDRMLAAQVLVEGHSIISRDVAFDACGVQRLW